MHRSSLLLLGVLLVTGLVIGMGWLFRGGQEGASPGDGASEASRAGERTSVDGASTASGGSGASSVSAERGALSAAPGGPVGGLDEELGGWQLTVRVSELESGLVVSGARCSLRSREDFAAFAEVVSDTEGLASFRGLDPAMDLELSVVAAGHALASWPVPPGSRHVDVVLQVGFPLRGRVVDGVTADPVAGASVLLRNEWTRHRIGETLVTDQEGRFVHAGVARSQPVELSVRKDGYVPLVQDGVWEEEPAPLELVLGAGAEVRGRVLDAVDRAIEGAAVRLEIVGAEGESSGSLTRTDATGSYRLRGLAAERSYRILARTLSGLEGQSAPFRIESDHDRREVDVRLESLHTGLQIEVKTSAGEALPGLRLMVLDGNDEVARNASTDEQGECLVAPLEPGPYTVRFEAAGRPIEIHPAWVERGQRTPLAIVVEAGRSVSGRVVDASGEPVPDQEVVFWFEVEPARRDVISLPPEFATPGSSWNQASTRTGPEGRFELRGLPDRLGVLRVGDALGFAGDEFTAHWASVDLHGVRPGADPLEVVLPTAARVVARITPVPTTRTALCQVAVGGVGWYHEVPVAADGALVLAFSRTGRPLDLMIDPHDGASWLHSGLILEAGRVLDLGELKQEAGGSVEGTVRDSAGRALAGAHVGVELEGFWWERDTLTDDRGTFRLQNLPTGSGRFVVNVTGYSPHRVALADLGADHRADPVLTRPGHILVEVADAEGRPGVGVRVQAELIGQPEVAESLRQARGTTDGAGRCRIEARVGRHRVRLLSESEERTVDVEVEVVEGGDVTARLSGAD